MGIQVALTLSTLDNGTRYGANFIVADVVATMPALPDDFNNGIVDAANYTGWRDQLNISTMVPNGTTVFCRWLALRASPGRVKSSINSSASDTGQRTTVSTSADGDCKTHGPPDGVQEGARPKSNSVADYCFKRLCSCEVSKQLELFAETREQGATTSEDFATAHARASM